jgi:hypothetical protein
MISNGGSYSDGKWCKDSVFFLCDGIFLQVFEKKTVSLHARKLNKRQYKYEKA